VDRNTVYYGQVPLETDLLNAQQMGMVALAKLSAGVLGTSTFVNGFTCTPTTPASLAVLLTAGEVYQLANLEASSWSSLPANVTNTILKQGIQLNPVQFGITPPGTVGFSQVYLIEVQYQDLDSGLVTLPYFNAANPASPFMGPGNSGQAQNTVRQGVVATQVKAGIAATTGTQVAPTPDAGWTGLFLVTVANGQATVTSGNITTYTGAPFLAPNGYLPQIPTGVQDSTWTFSNDTGGGGAPVATTSSTTTASATLNFSGGVPAYVAVGMRAYDLTTPAAITGGQTVLSKTATTVVLSANVNATVNSSDLITFSNNAYAATVVPTPPALLTGMGIYIKAATTNTGAATFNLNGLGNIAIHRANGFALAAGDIQAGQIVSLQFDGTFWQIVNYFGVASTSSTVNNFTTVNIPSAVDSGSVNAVVGNFSPAITSLVFGVFILVKIANTNTGPATMQCNALSAVNITHPDGTNLNAGDMVAGEVAAMAFDGTNFQLVSNLATQITIPTGNPTVYVRTDGNDNNNGLSNSPSGAWRTIQHAIARAQNIWLLQGKILTIQLGIPGTYDAFIVNNVIGSIVVKGDTSNQSGYIITGTLPVQGQTNGLILVTGSQLTLQGVTVSNTGNANTVCANFGGSVFVDHVTFLQSSGTNTFGILTAQVGGSIGVSGPITFAANAGFAMLAAGGQMSVSVVNITYSGGPIFAQANVGATSNGNLIYTGGATNSGSAQGARYEAILNGVVATNTGNTSFIPGTSPGFTQTGGQYA